MHRGNEARKNKCRTNYIATMEEQLKELIDKAQIADLLTRYFAAVDDKRVNMDIVKATFTSDAKIIRPDGSVMAGHENIFEGHKKSFAKFKATHHVITNFIIDINNNIATLRSNVIANHIWADDEQNPSADNKYFLADGVFSAKAVKVNNQWGISELRNDVVWRTGDGMKEMIRVFKQGEE